MTSNAPFFNTTFSPSTNLSNLSGKRCEFLSTWQNVLYSVGLTFILFGTIVGNSIVLAVFIFSKQLRSRLTSYFIISLACSDMIFAVFSVPFVVGLKLYNDEFCFHRNSCLVFIFTDALCTTASILALFLIAIDRFLAIVMPFQYTSLLNRRRALVILLFVWIFSIFWATAGIFNWNKDSSISVDGSLFCVNNNKMFYVVSFFGIYLVPLITMSFTYIIILKVAISHVKAIEATQVVSQPSILNVPNSNGVKRTRKNQRHGELKATKPVAVVYIAFLICWFPNLVINFIILLDDTYFPKLYTSNRVLFDFLFYTFVQILPILNTMVNPIIYNYFNKPFKKTLAHLCRKVKRHERHNNRRQSRIQSLESGGISSTATTLSSYINKSISSDQLN